MTGLKFAREAYSKRDMGGTCNYWLQHITFLCIMNRTLKGKTESNIPTCEDILELSVLVFELKVG